MQLAVAADVLNEGVHFPVNTSPGAIGHKSLAVNLSDMAAMGAEPAWFTMTLSLPHASSTWLDEFCAGLYRLAKEYNVQLVGGDTVQGPLSVSVQVGGYVATNEAFVRSGARAGDRIYVTGNLGDAAAGWAVINNSVTLDEKTASRLRHRLDFPEPRVTAALQLKGKPSAAIDISDGLLADLGHILEMSHCGARVNIDAIPVSDDFRSYVEAGGNKHDALVFGDDYELCFTSSCKESEIRQALDDCTVTCIGEIIAEPGLCIIDSAGNRVDVRQGGYEHFA